MGVFPHPIHVCCERQQLLLMALYYSFVLTVAFNQWIEETKQMKACFLFIEGIISVALNVGNNFGLYCMGEKHLPERDKERRSFPSGTWEVRSFEK